MMQWGDSRGRKYYPRKTENETQKCDVNIHEHNQRNNEEHEQNKDDIEIEKEKNAEP